MFFRKAVKRRRIPWRIICIGLHRPIHEHDGYPGDFTPEDHDSMTRLVGSGMKNWYVTGQFSVEKARHAPMLKSIHKYINASLCWFFLHFPWWEPLQKSNVWFPFCFFLGFSLVGTAPKMQLDLGLWQLTLTRWQPGIASVQCV